MTRQFNTQFHCPNCKTWHTQETLFGRWIRNNKDLASKKGYCVIDQDYFIHAYKTHENREFQCMMLVEIKTMGAAPSDAQRDTLWMIDQLMRNRSNTPTNKRRSQIVGAPLTVKSIMLKRIVRLKAFGAHFLSFSGLGPDDSETIKWDGSEIDKETLTKLLRFDLDPDTLRPIDLRRHHKTHTNQNLDFLADEYQPSV